jgi:tRNA-2-methylthio-N6-dimethylallyladenosine synthase
VASDFIVGFCGETAEDFQQTMRLVERCRFKNSFIFKYSVRAGTKAAQLFADDVPEEVKQQRNVELLNLTNRIAEEENTKFLGRPVEVLVEGPSKMSLRRQESGPVRQMTGRTPCDRIVVWDGHERQAGQTLNIFIHDVNCHTLFGSVQTQDFRPQVYALSGSMGR